MAEPGTISIHPGARQAALSVRRAWQRLIASDARFLALLALGWLVLLTTVSVLTAGQYGFHRDELNFIENARHLDWGYVEYPPLTPFIGWIVIQLAGPSLIGLRFSAALAVCLALWLTGLMTKELGGSRLAQSVAMLAAGTAPIVVFDTRFFSYQTFDFLWWVLTAYLLVRLRVSGNPRWWLSIGAVIGLGMMTKYSMPFMVAALAAGLLLTPARNELKSPWLWIGAAVALLIFFPNLAWQVQHNFISLDFQASTRAYNIQMGRTSEFLLQQFYICTNAAAITLWVSGLFFFLRKPAGERFGLLGWIYLVSLVLFLAASGRFYYMAGAYPALIAAGAAQTIRQPELAAGEQPGTRRRVSFGTINSYAWLAGTGIFCFATMIPMAPVTSAWWRFDASLNPEIREEIGWPELVDEVSIIYHSLPPEEQARAGILTANYGEAAAVNLYGPARGLPEAISGVNTYWLRGYGDPPPDTLVVLGLNRSQAQSLFQQCSRAGSTPNPYNIQNEETRDHPDIFLCRGLRMRWPEFWKIFHVYG